jgi:hypothetical protein
MVLEDSEVSHVAFRTGQCRGSSAVSLEPLPQPDQHCVGRFEGLLGVLRQRASQVGGFGLGVAQLGVARRPSLPDVERQQAQAHHSHEQYGGRPQGRTMVKWRSENDVSHPRSNMVAPRDMQIEHKIFMS